MNIQVFTDHFLKSTEFTEYVALLLPNTKYYCTVNNQRNGIDSYAHKIIKYHSQQSNIELTNEYTIQYEIVNINNSKLQNEYIKKCKLHPELSILCYYFKNNSPVVFTEVDLETYKYKEFKTENKICVYNPSEGCQIVFDGSKYYGAVNVHDTPSDSFLKINLFKIKRDKLIDYMRTAKIDVSEVTHDNVNGFEITDNYINANIQKKTTENIINITECSYNNEFENILYNSNELPAIQQIQRILSNITETMNIVCVNYATKEGVNYVKLLSEHGEHMKDIISIIDKNSTLCENNIYYKPKIIQNILTPDICHWILNECFKHVNWKQSTRKNYEYYAILEQFPHILNFILFISNFWLFSIRNMLSIPNKLNLNINEIFLAKYTTNKQINDYNSDGGFLIINIQLNDPDEFSGGEIAFYNENENLQLKKYDCIIYNGKKQRTPGNVSNGEKYMLVLMIEITP